MEHENYAYTMLLFLRTINNAIASHAICTLSSHGARLQGHGRKNFNADGDDHCGRHRTHEQEQECSINTWTRENLDEPSQGTCTKGKDDGTYNVAKSA